MQFEFSTASRIIFGSGRFSSLGKVAYEFGRCALITYNGPKIYIDKAMNLLGSQNIKSIARVIEHEPTIDLVRSLVDLAQSSSVDMVIGIGGGSAIDSAKATAVLVTNPGDITDYLELIGLNNPIINSPLPIIAIPSTSGTGSEVTKNAVIGSTQQHVKVSLRSPFLMPRIALIDPELTLTLPKSATAFSGLDALTQLIEAYTCNLPNPITDALCIQGIHLIAQSIYRALNDGNDLNARESMSVGSLLSGMALANAKLGVVHGLAGTLGGELNAPHGAICASLLANACEANLTALNDRDPENPAHKRYQDISKTLCNDVEAKPNGLLGWIRELCFYAQIPSLSTYGLIEQDFDTIIERASRANSTKGNPIPLLSSELRNILYKSL